MSRDEILQSPLYETLYERGHVFIFSSPYLLDQQALIWLN
jgi:hypothetical protein